MPTRNHKPSVQRPEEPHASESLRRNSDFTKLDHYQKRLAKQKGFGSYSEYMDSVVQRYRYQNMADYNAALLHTKGFESSTQHKAALAKKLGLASASEYDMYLMRKRAKRPRNRRFALWLNTSLKTLGYDHRWLAGRLKVDTWVIDQYREGFNIPREKRLLLIIDIVTKHSTSGFKIPHLPPDVRTPPQPKKRQWVKFPIHKRRAPCVSLVYHHHHRRPSCRTPAT